MGGSGWSFILFFSEKKMHSNPPSLHTHHLSSSTSFHLTAVSSLRSLPILLRFLIYFFFTSSPLCSASSPLPSSFLFFSVPASLFFFLLFCFDSSEVSLYFIIFFPFYENSQELFFSYSTSILIQNSPIPSYFTLTFLSYDHLLNFSFFSIFLQYPRSKSQPTLLPLSSQVLKMVLAGLS